MAKSHLAGPLLIGSRDNISFYLDGTTRTGPNQGYVLTAQDFPVLQSAGSGTAAVSSTIYIDDNCKIGWFQIDGKVAWDSATSDTLSIGIAAGGTEYVSGVDAKATGRLEPTYTATQLGNFRDTSTNRAVVATITQVGASTVGTTYVTMYYWRLVSSASATQDLP